MIMSDILRVQDLVILQNFEFEETILTGNHSFIFVIGKFSFGKHFTDMMVKLKPKLFVAASASLESFFLSDNRLFLFRK